MQNYTVNEVDELMEAFANLFTHPTEEYSAYARRCSELLDEEGRTIFAPFLQYALNNPIGDMQAKFTQLFELNFHVSLYTGYYLFGESYLRSMFLVGLAERFKKHSYDVKGELHDHLSVILGFLAAHPNSVLAAELRESALIPMLNRILWGKTRVEDRPEDENAISAYFALFKTLLYALSGNVQEMEDVITLPVNDEPTERDIDQWIRGGKRKKEEKTWL